MLLIYLEPESAADHPWLPESRESIQTLDSDTASAMRVAVRKLVSSLAEDVDIPGFYDELLLSAHLGAEPRATLDSRIAQAVRLLRENRDARRSLLDLAREVGLSPRRFRHLFRREIGMSAQSYVVWLRINEACADLARGASLSDAAYEAGFSDAAHFTRTFRRTFGLAPSQVANRLVLAETSSDATRVAR